MKMMWRKHARNNDIICFVAPEPHYYCVLAHDTDHLLVSGSILIRLSSSYRDRLSPAFCANRLLVRVVVASSRRALVSPSAPIIIAIAACHWPPPPEPRTAARWRRGNSYVTQWTTTQFSLFPHYFRPDVRSTRLDPVGIFHFLIARVNTMALTSEYVCMAPWIWARFRRQCRYSTQKVLQLTYGSISTLRKVTHVPLETYPTWCSGAILRVYGWSTGRVSGWLVGFLALVRTYPNYNPTATR